MKLFAPKNNWDMKSPESWWPFIGSIQTSSGVAITEKSALTLSAYSCGVRVISETISSLPCHLLERKDERTYAKAVDHPLYSIVHDEPNAEQDSMGFFDSQLALLVGWGDCYAEVERFAGEVTALWPIHPSRIPLRNIRRNGRNPQETYAGQPGELVFYVNNDDGSESPIPASQMLHIPGVLSQNGITGQGHVALGRNALGISQATEDHAAAFFKNGANPNIAIKSPKIVGKETADRLRQQWQTVFGGVKNHYKTVLLEDGMEPIPFTFSPQVTQLIESRQHNVIEMARLLRIPPYFLMDLQQAKFNNVESQGQDLVIFSLMPWIVRLEKGMRRQLLTPEQKKKYKFRFNVMGLLRGDQAARSAFYQAGFNMGVFSPNDIREYEDLNPVEGGDQRFVPANNLVPLTAIGEMAQATIDKTKAETERAQRPDPVPVAPAAPDESDDDTAEAVAEMRQARAEFLVAIEQIRSETMKPADWQAFLDKFSGYPKEFAAQLAPELNALRETLEVVNESGTRVVADNRAEREAFLSAVTDGLKPVVESSEKMSDAVAKMAYNSGNHVEEVLKPLFEAQNERIEALSGKVEQNSADIKAIEIPAPIEPPPVDTSAAEALAVREAALEQERAALAARLTAEREATHSVLCVAMRIRLEGLAEWESDEIGRAASKPSDFKAWREKFYKRFIKQFGAKMTDFVSPASQIGVALDIDAAADTYALESINDLKTLDEFAADKWHDRLKEGVDSLRKNVWTGRASALANEMVEQGKQRFKEQKYA